MGVNVIAHVNRRVTGTLTWGKHRVERCSARAACGDHHLTFALVPRVVNAEDGLGNLGFGPNRDGGLLVTLFAAAEAVGLLPATLSLETALRCGARNSQRFATILVSTRPEQLG